MLLQITSKQKAFIDATAYEVLFGGAAGGGKSYGQLVDAFLFALKYPKSKQLILRRTFPELEKSLIRTQLQLFPREVYSYNHSQHTGRFKNGSIIDFGYCDNETDVYKYQSSEYDVIRFDEATHFTEFMYIYLTSRCRGANKIPKQIKSSTNPGGVGHTFFKKRFITPAPWGEEFTDIITNQKRIFIPSKVSDNKFLMDADPEYINRLDALPEKERQALKNGSWDILEGRFFTEFSRDRHVIEPYDIPKKWIRFASLDYGLDMLAYLVFAVTSDGRYVVTHEIYEPNLIISEACEKIKDLTADMRIQCTFAPQDLWARSRESGVSRAQRFTLCGVPLTMVSSSRVSGWANVHEWLYFDEEKNIQPSLFIFKNCVNLIRTLPELQHDRINVNDVAKDPHELTHAPDALRYGLSGQIRPERTKIEYSDSKKRIYGQGEKMIYVR